MLGLSAAAIADGYAVGAALLGLWLVTACPEWGPRTFAAGFRRLALAYLLLLLTGPLTSAAMALAGKPFALLFVFLPVLTFAFWASACLLRLYVAAAGLGR
jgi:hypothetical protein